MSSSSSCSDDAKAPCLLETDVQPDAPEVTEHVLHMWQPFSFTVPEDYDYLRRGAPARLATRLLRDLVHVILWAANGLALGFSVEGRENLRALSGGAVAICNHIHPMDCTMVDMALARRRLYYVSLASNFRIPVVRRLIRVLGAVPLTESKAQMAGLFAAMGEALSGGDIVQIYPEGVMVPYFDGLRKFRNGAFHLAATEDKPILPLVVTAEAPHGFFALYKAKPCLHLHILPAEYPDAALPARARMVELKKRCVSRMQACLDAHAPREPVDSETPELTESPV